MREGRCLGLGETAMSDAPSPYRTRQSWPVAGRRGC